MKKKKLIRNLPWPSMKRGPTEVGPPTFTGPAFQVTGGRSEENVVSVDRTRDPQTVSLTLSQLSDPRGVPMSFYLYHGFV